MARIVFLGTPAYGATILEALLVAGHDVSAVVTQPDGLAGRGRHDLQVSPVKRVAVAHGLTLFQSPVLRRDSATISALESLRPDVLVLAAYGQMLRRPMLNLAPAGCVGVHASLLPKYRGAAPVSAAILAGDPETGVSLMLTEAGMDSGPVIAQQAMPVAADDTTGSLTARLADLGAELLVRTLPSWLRGGIVPTPQDGSAATYAPETRREDGGIDWYESAVRIDRVVRAMQPWPGAFCGCGEATLKIGAARPVSDWRGDGQPGSVVRLGREVGVVTGDGLLLLDTVQLEGRRAMHAGDFARGRGDLYELVLACALRRT